MTIMWAINPIFKKKTTLLMSISKVLQLQLLLIIAFCLRLPAIALDKKKNTCQSYDQVGGIAEEMLCEDITKAWSHAHRSSTLRCARCDGTRHRHAACCMQKRQL